MHLGSTRYILDEGRPGSIGRAGSLFRLLIVDGGYFDNLLPNFPVLLVTRLHAYTPTRLHAYTLHPPRTYTLQACTAVR